MRTDAVRRRGFSGAWLLGAAGFAASATLGGVAMVGAIAFDGTQLDAAKALNAELAQTLLDTEAGHAKLVAQLDALDARPPGDCCQSLFECGMTVERLEFGCDDAGVAFIERANILFECEQTICPVNGWVCESPECAYLSADDYFQHQDEHE